MKAPVGLLSDRTVLRSKMEGLTPTSSRLRSNESPSGAFKRQNGLAQQDGRAHPDKFAFAQRSAAMKAPVGLLSDRTVLRKQDGRAHPDKFAFGVRIGRVVDACRPVKGCVRK